MPNSLVLEEPGGSHRWAEVRAHDQVMRYRRLGTGRPLLVLEACSELPIHPELRRALAESHRLVMPELPTGEVHLANWLSDFMEGMGTSRLPLLATEGFFAPALELALLGNDQVARIAFLAEDRGMAPYPTETHAQGVVDSATTKARVPVLLLRRTQSLSEIVALVRNFLSEA